MGAIQGVDELCSVGNPSGNGKRPITDARTGIIAACKCNNIDFEEASRVECPQNYTSRRHSMMPRARWAFEGLGEIPLLVHDIKSQNGGVSLVGTPVDGVGAVDDLQVEGGEVQASQDPSTGFIGPSLHKAPILLTMWT